MADILTPSFVRLAIVLSIMASAMIVLSLVVYWAIRILAKQLTIKRSNAFTRLARATRFSQNEHVKRSVPFVAGIMGFVTALALGIQDVPPDPVVLAIGAAVAGLVIAAISLTWYYGLYRVNQLVEGN